MPLQKSKIVVKNPGVYTNWSKLQTAAIGVWDRSVQRGFLMPKFTYLLAPNGGPSNNLFLSFDVFTDFVNIAADGLPVQHIQNATDEKELFFAAQNSQVAALLHGHT